MPWNFNQSLKLPVLLGSAMILGDGCITCMKFSFFTGQREIGFDFSERQRPTFVITLTGS